MTSQAPCVSTETKKIEQKKQKNCDRANKKINKRKGCLDTNKQSDRL